jgi:hypothetical protein
MSNTLEVLVRLTNSDLSESDRNRSLNDFAEQLGWKPSDQIRGGATLLNATHLVVEHGLERAAVFSFFKDKHRYAELNPNERMSLLSLSYNNLVDWHICFDADLYVTYIFNRSDPPTVVESFRLSQQDQIRRIRADAFEEITSKKPSAKVIALDESIIRTVSFWKRNLCAELSRVVPNNAISALFNTVFFLRAVEDQRTRYGRAGSSLWDQLAVNVSTFESLAKQLRSAVDVLDIEIPPYLIDWTLLSEFDGLSYATAVDLVRDFYRSRFTPYNYDFSVMSKHALSRIYEHYVTILRPEITDQTSLLPTLPTENTEKSWGAVYTPEYIARFFVRYIRENLSPFQFKRLRSIDPSCGSGIFMRTLLEFQCDPIRNPEISTEQIKEIFSNVYAADADENACQATRLSLALLYLVLTDKLPMTLNVRDLAIENISSGELPRTFDAIIANPPFVSRSTQQQSTHEGLSSALGTRGYGRSDLYQLFLAAALDMLEPGGYACFVLPHSFLINKSGKELRAEIGSSCWIRCLVDLSEIPVFGDKGIYVILLIIQKKSTAHEDYPATTIVQCSDFVGQALQYAIEGKFINTSSFNVFEVPQSTFQTPDWVLTTPEEARLKNRLGSHPTLGSMCEVKVGVITGANDVFIQPTKSVPKSDEKIWVPYLPDRNILAFERQEEVGLSLFYPFVNRHKLSSDDLKLDYPKTWDYLYSHKDTLAMRGQVVADKLDWWEPERPRRPEDLLVPKIVSPHLVITPKFGLDEKGKFAVVRSPIIFPKGEPDVSLLKYILAFLNSTAGFWFIERTSNKYSKGYLLLEPKSLKSLPIPNPRSVEPVTRKHLISLVGQRLLAHGTEALKLEQKIDMVVAEIYGLSNDEMRLLGLEIPSSNV